MALVGVWWIITQPVGWWGRLWEPLLPGDGSHKALIPPTTDGSLRYKRNLCASFQGIRSLVTKEWALEMSDVLALKQRFYKPSDTRRLWSLCFEFMSCSDFSPPLWVLNVLPYPFIPFIKSYLLSPFFPLFFALTLWFQCWALESDLRGFKSFPAMS